MRGILSGLALVAALVVVIWAIGALLGFEIALVPSLLVSVGATALLSLLLRAARTRRPRAT